MPDLTLTLPLAPSLNNAYETKVWGRRLSNEGKAYKAAAALLARHTAAAGGWTYAPGQRVALTVTLWFESAKSSAQSDIDNRFKLLGDALAAALGYNDHAVDEIVLRRGGVDAEQPRCEVVVAVRPAPVKVRAPRKAPQPKGRAA